MKKRDGLFAQVVVGLFLALSLAAIAVQVYALF